MYILDNSKLVFTFFFLSLLDLRLYVLKIVQSRRSNDVRSCNVIFCGSVFRILSRQARIL